MKLKIMNTMFLYNYLISSLSNDEAHLKKSKNSEWKALLSNAFSLKLQLRKS